MAHELITIATAECFTHGKVAQEIHAFSQKYPANYSWQGTPDEYKLSIVGSVFAPTITGVKSLLQIQPLPPVTTLNDIKVYDEAGDLEMSLMMANAIRDITGADIGIGTTAGIGKGGIAVCNHELCLSGTSEIYADLRSAPTDLILKRQQSGIENALYLLENLIKDKVEFLDSEKFKIIPNIQK